jgi:hypothetical protein
MMRRTPGVIFNVVGQSIDLRFALGRPTSATFIVLRAYAEDESTPEFSGTATVDAPNATLTAAAGPSQADPQRLPLTSTAGVTTGRKYTLSQNSLSEVVQPVEVGSGYVRVRSPLQNDYTSGAAFASTILTAAIDSTFIQDRSKLSDLSDTYPDFRVKWSVLYAGQTYTVYSFFDVVRVQVTHDVDIADVNDRAPGLHETLPIEYRAEDGRPLIDAAYRMVRAHMQAVSVDINAIRDDEVIDELVILGSLRILAEGGWSPSGIDRGLYLERATTNFDRFFEQHFQIVLKHRIDQQRGLLSQNERPRVAPIFRK